MRIFKQTPQWDFMGKKKIAFVISAILLVVSIAGLFTKELSYGVDFKGGTIIQIQFKEEPSLEKIRTLFQKQLTTSVNITTFGDIEDNEVIITLSQDSIKDSYENLADVVHKILKNDYSGYDIRRVETVGAKIGGELRSKGVQAALYVLAGILIYIGFRFKVRYGIAAVVALFHDVLITLCFFIFLEKEFTLTILAALMTIIGYSLNDTIVVFDRVRENVARFPRSSLTEVINLSINESLSRTILTSVTTFLVVAALFVFGGEIIHDFSFAMLIGLVVGTYSSVFVASPVVIFFDPERLQKNSAYNSMMSFFNSFSKTKKVK